MIRQAEGVFTRAAARHFDSQRLGDQYGTLMAGAWSLLSDVVPTQEEAEQCIACHDWESYSQSTELSDEQRCIQTVLQHQLRVECPDRSVTRTATTPETMSGRLETSRSTLSSLTHFSAC